MTRYSRHQRAAFTLVELLITMALIAVLSALMAPAVRGLLGVTGPRGGVNTLTAAIEQARLTAMESGVPSYLGLPVDENGISKEERYSSFLIFREKRPDEEIDGDPALVPVTRWLRLPQGIYLEVEDQDFPADSPSIPQNTLPKLGDFDIGRGGGSTMKVLKFDRFGKLHPDSYNEGNDDDEAAENVVVLKVGPKKEPDGNFFPDDDKNFFELTVQPLTGRTTVVDKALEEEEEGTP